MMGLLYVESLIAFAFPLLLGIGFIGALSILGWLPSANPWFHLLFLLAVIAISGFWLWRNYRSIRWPDREQAWRRIEKESGLSHRPLIQLADRQATNLIDPLARALWRENQKRLNAEIKSLRFGLPDFAIARRDPWALRTIVVMIAIMALASHSPTAMKKAMLGFMPNFSSHLQDIAADLWISPPDYTHIAPLHLNANIQANNVAGEETIAIPADSKILAQVTGSEEQASLQIDDTKWPMNVIDEGSHQLEQILQDGDKLSIVIGRRVIASWPINIIKDAPPIIDFAGKPVATEKGALRIPYAGKDDYGIRQALLHLSLNQQNFDVTLNVPTNDNKEIKGTLYQDLTAHPWAGLEVKAQLVAKDAKGQAGESPAITLTLPERRFSNPVAKAIIAARKALVKEPHMNREVATALRGLSERPDLFDHQKSVFLGLGIAWRRLLSLPKGDEAEFSSVIQLMWEIAVSLEDGKAGDALAELRRLQKELQDALARNAPQEEIDRLMNQIQQAMNEYMRQLQQQVEQALRQGQTPRLTKPGLSVTQQDLNKMLEEARRMAQSGSKDSAQQLLDQLQQMLENLQAGIPMPSPEGSGEGQKMLNDLARTMRKQQQLLNESFQQQNEGQSQDGQAQQDAAEQEQLRQGLGGLMRRMAEAMGDLPQGMGEAEQQMRDAVEALKNQDYDGAAQAQNNALNHLQRSLQSLSQSQRQTLGNRRDKMDPLGRLSPEDSEDSDGQSLDNQNIGIPEESATEQARRIFQELLERRNDLSRPKDERDYLDRLLKQF